MGYLSRLYQLQGLYGIEECLVIIRGSAQYLAENLGKTQHFECHTPPEDNCSSTVSPTIL
jgi:hypothetical protein